MAQVTCTNCGSSSPDTQRFCGSCGVPLERLCSRCGEPNPPAHKFCGSCGAALDAESQVAPVEERRWATVVFADLSGFTELSERTDPEEVRSLADRCAEKVGEIVQRYGGWVNRVIGDATLAVFGAPVAHEDDAERAVRAALEMKQCSFESAADFGHLSLSIGINTGEVMVAPVGPEGARDPTVMGDVVNTAARLQHEASSGEILVGEQTYEATRKSIRYEEIEPFRAKGKQVPVRAWAPLEVIAEPAERLVSGAALVGRDRELDLLLQIWGRTVAESRPHLVSVMGAPGIGKTRLVREFLTAARPPRAVRGRSLPYGEMTGYGAFAQQLKQLADVFDSDPATVASQKIDHLAERLLPRQDADSVANQWKAFLGLEAEGVADRQVLFVAARRLVEATARAEPTIFIFEDVHWADESMLDLIEMLASRTRDAPALFLTLARPELLNTRPAWGGGLVSYTALPLDPLTVDDARALILHLLEKADTPALARSLSERAEGNPLFIEELAASMTERTDAATSELPTTVQGIIAARLDSLPGPARSVLLDASIVGKVFWRGALEAIDRRPDLDQSLDFLEARDFVRRQDASSFQGDDEFTFKHMLIREVAYATVPKAGRRERHAAVAGFIERVAGDAAESASLLAHHWKEAGETAKAIDYLITAADRAQRAWAKREAIELIDTALELIPAEDGTRSRSLRLFKARLFTEDGIHDQALAVLDPLLPELERAELAEATFLEGRAAFWLLDVERIKRCANTLAELVELPDGADFRGPALYLRQLVESMAGRTSEAIDVGKKAITQWPAGHLETDLTAAEGLLAVNLIWVGRFEEGLHHSRRAHELGVELQSVEGAMHAGAQMALALAGLGRHDEALRSVQEVIARWREFEAVPRQTSRALNMWGGVLREIFLIEESRERNEEAIELGRRVPFQNAVAQGIVDLLFADLAENEVGRAASRLSEATEEAAKLKGWHEWLVGTRLAEARAAIALQTSSPEEAAEIAASSVEYTRRHGRVKYEAASRVVLAAALERLGRARDAIAELRRAVQDAERIGHPPTLWRATAALGRALYNTGEDAGAETAFARAREVVESLAERLEDKRRTLFLEAPEIAAIVRTT